MYVLSCFSVSPENCYGLLDLKQLINQSQLMSHSWKTWVAFPGKDEQRYPPPLSGVRFKVPRVFLNLSAPSFCLLVFIAAGKGMALVLAI